MKNKALGYVFIALVLLAASSMIYYREVSNSIPENYSQQENKQSDLKTFTDSSESFEFSYRKDYQFVSSQEAVEGWTMFSSVSAKTIAGIKISADAFPKTNFAESYFVVAQDASIKNPLDCKKYAIGIEDIKTANQVETINGVVFNKAEVNGAGAGNFYETRMYRIFHSGLCYEITLTLHTTNIANYEPGTITEVNKDQAWAKIIQILNTFKFTDQKTEAKTSGIISGHVIVGPLCPGPVSDSGCNSIADYSGTKILIYSNNGVDVIKTVGVDGSGNYSVSLDPGTYSVSFSTNYGMASGVKNPGRVVTVVAGKTATADIIIDTGIR